VSQPGTYPAQEHRARIRRCVADLLDAHRGAGAAVSQAAIARHVKATLELHQQSEDTIRRRVKECVSDLCSEGMQVCSDARGYWLANGPADVAAGRRYLIAQVRSMARRLRSFDAAAGDRLAQLALDLDGAA
jgi:hypothetical protein